MMNSNSNPNSTIQIFYDHDPNTPQIGNLNSCGKPSNEDARKSKASGGPGQERSPINAFHNNSNADGSAIKSDLESDQGIQPFLTTVSLLTEAIKGQGFSRADRQLC
jgi:hypothetical protein